MNQQLILGMLLTSSVLVPYRAVAQQVQRVVVDAKINCSELFQYNLDKGKCEMVDVKKLDILNSLNLCKSPGLAFSEGKCVVDEAHLPTPTCTSGGLPSVFDVALKQCVVNDKLPTSGKGDFLGDCFRVLGLPKGGFGEIKSDSSYLVRAQGPLSDGDRILSLLKYGDNDCGKNNEHELIDVKASDLIRIGANRVGWTYGVLALPYKYHFDDKSFTSGFSIGPYFGRRWGTPGSAYTFAAAATIGSVKGEVHDSAGNVTSTPDIQAFSATLGFMWDIAKSADYRPFKMGVFYGVDIVGDDNSVKYAHNRKPWLSFQIGFDFTDN